MILLSTNFARFKALSFEGLLLDIPQTDDPAIEPQTYPRQSIAKCAYKSLTTGSITISVVKSHIYVLVYEYIWD